MNHQKEALYGLKFNPFSCDVPVEALYTSPTIDSFIRRIELTFPDGGFAMITGDPGTGKSVALRLLKERFKNIPDIVVGIIEHPQSRTSDFYREIGDLFGIPLCNHNRWASFKMLRQKWAEYISSTHKRPILIVDEAQETITTVFNEIRLLSSKDLDSKQLLYVIFCGDQRLPDRFRWPDLMPLGTRIRRRILLDYASPAELAACLDHLLAAAGNSALMSAQLKASLVDHCVGNYRVLMNTADELLAAATDKQLPSLDEKLFLELYSPPVKPKLARKK